MIVLNDPRCRPLMALLPTAADPAIARIVADECSKRGVPYSHYATLPQIISRFTA